MAVKFANNVSTTLSAAINATQTTISVADASGLPTLSSGDYVYLTLDTDTNSPTIEVVKVTAISSNDLTVVRGQDGTTASSFSNGTKIELRVTAAALDDISSAADTESVSISGDTMTGKLTINNANYASHLELVRGSDTLYLTPSGGQLITNGGLSPDVTNTDDLGRSDKYWQDLWLGTSLKMGGTTVIDSSRNVENVANITGTGNLSLDASGGGEALLRVTGLNEGRLQLSNQSNWGLIAKGVANSPEIGMYHSGQLKFVGFADSEGNALQTSAGSNGVFMNIHAGDGKIYQYLPLSVVGDITSSAAITAAGINNATGEIIDLDHPTYTIIKNPENAVALYLGDSGDAGNYYQNNAHHFRKTDGSTYMLSVQEGGTNIRSGSLQMNGSQVIDSSRNITAGTISSGAITSSGDIDAAGDIYTGSSNSRFKENQLRFNASGASYIDQATTGQILYFRTSNNSSLDTTWLEANSAGQATFGGNVIVEGNLTVSGTTTTIDTANLNVEDNNITLNYSTGDSSATANGAGITIQDAVDASTNATITWNTAQSRFDYSHPVYVSGQSLFVGTSTADNEYAAQFQNSAGSTILRARNDGRVLIPSGYLYAQSSEGIYSTGSIKARGGITNDGGNDLSISSGSTNITFNNKNLTSVGTITSGNISVGNITTSTAAIFSNNAFAFLTTGSAAQDIRTKSVFAGTSYGDTPPAGSFNATNTYELNGTTVIDSSRNLTNIGTYSGAGDVVAQAANVLFHARSSADGQTVGFRAGYLNHTTLQAFFRYTTGDAQLYIDNDFQGNNAVYSNINFRNKANNGTSLINRMTIHGSTGHVNITGGALQMGGTTVIDSSRNVIGTIRPSVDNAWKIRGNSGNANLAFEYSTSTGLADANIKVEIGNTGNFIVGDRLSNMLSSYQIELKKANISIGDGGGAGSLNLRATGNFYLRHNGSDALTFNGSTITASDNFTIANNSADPTLTFTTTSTTADPVIQMNGQAGIASEGFEIWYDNTVGDVHLHTTYNHNDASIRFHTKTGASKGTSNERFRIDGSGYTQITSHTNGWDGGLRMVSADGTDTYKIHPDDNGYMYVDKNWYFTGAVSIGSIGQYAWHSGNDGSGSGLDADLLDGHHKDDFDHFEKGKKWTGISASGTQARRFHIARLYGCPAHWDSNWQNIEFHVTAETYESGTLKFRMQGDYNGGNQNTWLSLYLTEAHGPLVGDFRFVMGTATAAGWNNSGQPTYYIDLFAEARYYAGFTVHAKTYGHTYQTSNPSSGGATTVFYSSPTVTNITDFGSQSHMEPKHRGYTVWNAGNHGSGSGLDADTVDSLHASSFLRSDAADTATGNIEISTGTSQPLKLTTSSAGPWAIELYRSDTANSSKVFNSGSAWYFQHNILLAGNTNWHAGNDGAGSGLDADLLDGQQGSYYLNYNNLSNKPTIPTNNNQLTNGAGYVSSTTLNANDRIFISDTRSADRPPSYYDDRYVQADFNQSVNFGISGGDSWGTALTVSKWASWNAAHRQEQLIFAGTKLARRVATSDSAWSSAHTIWDSSTDGSGSGLDADTLDGIQATGFVNQNGTYTLASGYSVAQGDWGLRNTTPSGWIQFGPANSTWAHIYSSGQNFYFNNNLYVLGNLVWNASNDGSGSGLDADLLDGQQGSYYYAASNPSGYQTSSGAVAQSDRVSGSAFATTGSPDSVLEYQQAASITDTKLAPSADWHNSIRMGHGNPYSYYSNTIAIRMTGSGLGDLYTQTISNNNAQGWNKHWHNNNDGSGSGLDADLLDGQHGSHYLNAANFTGTAPTGSPFLSDFVHIGNASGSGYSTDDGSWGSRLNVSSTIHAKIEVSQQANSMRSHWYAHTGQDSIKFGTSTGHDVELQRASGTKLKLVAGGSLAYEQMIFQSGGIGRADHHYGHLIGSYNNVAANSAKTNPIYIIGSAYQPTATSFSNMYGVGYAHNNIWGTANGRSSGWGFYSVDNGTVHFTTTPARTWSQGEFNRNGYVVWDAFNDGSGSTLDADLLDGQHGSYYYSSANHPPQTNFENVFNNLSTSTGASADLNNTFLNDRSGNFDCWSGSNFPPSTTHVQGVQVRHSTSTDYGWQLASQYSQPGKMYLRHVTNGTFYDWHTLWTSANDGSGSGLDADTLDTLQASSFIRSDADDLVTGHTEWQDGYQIRLGNGADFRMHHDGSNHYFRNYLHTGGDIYFQGEDSNGSNRALIYMITNSSAPYVQLFHVGNEKLRTVSAGIQVYGDLTATGNVTAYSDIRKKTNIKPLEGGLDIVKALEPKRFDWIESGEGSLGFIAQEVEEYLPELVETKVDDIVEIDEEQNPVVVGEEEVKSLDYGKMVSVLWAAVKEQAAQIESLNKRIQELENGNN